MSDDLLNRRLSTILAADVQGYSRLMGEDDEGTVKRLASYRNLIEQITARHGGHVAGSAGDSVIAEFSSAVEALRCAVAIQEELGTRNADLPVDQIINFRMGLSIGDIIDEGRDIHGDGVNVAARLQEVADPGGICISASAYEQVKNKVAFNFEDLDARALKNIVDPVHIYRVAIPNVAVTVRARREMPRSKWGRVPAVAVVGIIVLAAVSIAYWQNLGGLTSRANFATLGDPARPSKEQGAPAIAVLPFTNMSADPDQEYFSDGIAEDLIINLAQNPNLTVLARRTSFFYKGKSIAIRELCDRLGVEYLIEGSVRRANDRVRVTVQLVNASGEHVWALSFDRGLKDIFAVQDEITQKISATLTAKLDLAQVLKVPTAPSTTNLEAYDAFLRGRQKFQQWTPKDNTASIADFDRAIKLDPTFSRAYAYRAFTRINRFRFMGLGFQPLPKASLLDGALDDAKKAVALDVKDYFGHAVLGYVYLYRGEKDDAKAELQKSIDVNPNDPETLYQWARVLLLEGKAAGAVRLLDLAVKLDPMVRDYKMLLGMSAYLSDDYDKAIAAFKGTIDTYKAIHKGQKDSDPVGPHIWMAAAFGQKMKPGAADKNAASYKAATEQKTIVLSRLPNYRIALAAERYKRAWRREYFCRIVEGLEKAGFDKGYTAEQRISDIGCL